MNFNGTQLTYKYSVSPEGIINIKFDNKPQLYSETRRADLRYIYETIMMENDFPAPGNISSLHFNEIIFESDGYILPEGLNTLTADKITMMPCSCITAWPSNGLFTLIAGETDIHGDNTFMSWGKQGISGKKGATGGREKNGGTGSDGGPGTRCCNMYADLGRATLKGKPVFGKYNLELYVESGMGGTGGEGGTGGQGKDAVCYQHDGTKGGNGGKGGRGGEGAAGAILNIKARFTHAVDMETLLFDATGGAAGQGGWYGAPGRGGSGRECATRIMGSGKYGEIGIKGEEGEPGEKGLVVFDL